jgi:hypothetical protein
VAKLRKNKAAVAALAKGLWIFYYLGLHYGVASYPEATHYTITTIGLRWNDHEEFDEDDLHIYFTQWMNTVVTVGNDVEYYYGVWDSLVVR